MTISVHLFKGGFLRAGFLVMELAAFARLLFGPFVEISDMFRMYIPLIISYTPY